MAITNVINATMQMRRGLEQNFDSDQMLPGEWAVSLDAKYVRMCFAPGLCLRMATYESFEQDLEEVNRILSRCEDAETAVQDAIAEFLRLAEQHETAAKDYADISQSYAVGTDNVVRPQDIIDNAKYYYEQALYYYQQALEIAEGLGGALIPGGTITFAELPDIEDVRSGIMYNISDEFTTTDLFKEGAGRVVPAGSNIYKTADGMWDVLAGSPVTGVKGAGEANYRSGNVNLTAENIGLGNVGNYKAVSTEADQELSDAEQQNALSNLGYNYIKNTLKTNEFSESESYSFGNYVSYNNKLYRCNYSGMGGIYGEWNPAYWDEIDLLTFLNGCRMAENITMPPIAGADGGGRRALAAMVDNMLPKNGNAQNLTSSITMPVERDNILSSDRFHVVFGKIKKWFTDMTAAAFAQIISSKADVLANTVSGRLADALAIKDIYNELNSNLLRKLPMVCSYETTYNNTIEWTCGGLSIIIATARIGGSSGCVFAVSNCFIGMPIYFLHGSSGDFGITISRPSNYHHKVTVGSTPVSLLILKSYSEVNPE